MNDKPTKSGSWIKYPKEWYDEMKVQLLKRWDIKRVYALSGQLKSVSAKKQMCSGCYNQRYNFPTQTPSDGGAPVTCEHCWNLIDALMVDREIYLKGYDTKPTLVKKTLSCYVQRR